MPRNREEEPRDWKPGRVELATRSTQRWAMVFNDGGELVCRFKRTDSTLGVSFDELPTPVAQVSWRDAVPIYATFPRWVRQAVEQSLGLRETVHTEPAESV